MTKKVLSFVLVLILCVSLSAAAFAANGARLIDDADLLTESEERTLTERLNVISEAYQVDVIIVTVDSTGAMNADEYIEFFYDEGGFGYGNDHDGVMLLVAMEERQYRILSNGLGAKAISPSDIDNISDLIAPSLSDEDYAEAFSDFADECEYLLEGEINGFPFNYAKNILISLAIGLVVALIVTGSMKGKLKSVRMQPAATQYTKAGSMKITDQRELFLYRNVSRRKKETSKPAAKSRSSSRNIGGGSF